MAPRARPLDIVGRGAALWLCFAACAPDATTPTAIVTTPAVACTDATWASFAHAFFIGWCTSCHSPLLTGAARGGAPEGVDFATLQEVSAWAGPIGAAATGDAPTMPPGGGPTDAERARLAEWLACGLPGDDTGAAP